jgi:hypothetical protein
MGEWAMSKESALALIKKMESRVEGELWILLGSLLRSARGEAQRNHVRMVFWLAVSNLAKAKIVELEQELEAKDAG